MAEKEKTGPSFAERITPILVILVVGLAFVTGSLWQKVNSLTSGGTVANQAGQQPTQPQAPYEQLSDAQKQTFTEVSSFTISRDNTNFEGEHMRGSADAEVFLIEYSDLECPFCSSFHQTAKQVFEEYNGKVAWIYRHFPLDSIHPNAREAALGAECVAAQAGNDAFWSFADEVFSNQQTAFTRLADIASEVGVDKGAYETCVASATYAENVDSDYQAGLDVGVTGTPGNFVMNKDGEIWTVYGAVPYATLKEAVEEALN